MLSIDTKWNLAHMLNDILHESASRDLAHLRHLAIRLHKRRNGFEPYFIDPEALAGAWLVAGLEDNQDMLHIMTLASPGHKGLSTDAWYQYFKSTGEPIDYTRVRKFNRLWAVDEAVAIYGGA
jgi:hypothetical protein